MHVESIDSKILDCLNRLVIWKMSVSPSNVISRGDAVEIKVTSKSQDIMLHSWRTRINHLQSPGIEQQLNKRRIRRKMSSKMAAGIRNNNMNTCWDNSIFRCSHQENIVTVPNNQKSHCLVPAASIMQIFITLFFHLIHRTNENRTGKATVCTSKDNNNLFIFVIFSGRIRHSYRKKRYSTCKEIRWLQPTESSAYIYKRKF